MEADETLEERRKLSFKDLFKGNRASQQKEEEGCHDEDDVSDDDMEDDEGDSHYFSLGLTKEEKRELRRSWRSSLIIKLGKASDITIYSNVYRRCGCPNKIFRSSTSPTASTLQDSLTGLTTKRLS